MSFILARSVLEHSARDAQLYTFIRSDKAACLAVHTDEFYQVYETVSYFFTLR